LLEIPFTIMSYSTITSPGHSQVALDEELEYHLRCAVCIMWLDMQAENMPQARTPEVREQQQRQVDWDFERAPPALRRRTQRRKKRKYLVKLLREVFAWCCCGAGIR
jgi:hypothetical protein